VMKLVPHTMMQIDSFTSQYLNISIDRLARNKEAAKRIEIYKNPGKYSEWLAHLNKSNVGRFDYECRDAKLLISSIGNVGGLGYEIRKASAGVLLAGFNSGRVVNFVNNINGIQPWGLALSKT